MPSTVSSETNVPITDWSIGSLKIYHDEKLELLHRFGIQQISYERQISDQRDLRYQERWAAQEEAAKNLKEYQNEFRGSLSDLSTKMATKDELQAVSRGLIDKIEAQEKVNTEFRSRLDVGNPAIGTIQNQLATSQGMKTQSDLTRSDMFKYLSAIVGILGALILLSNGVFK